RGCPIGLGCPGVLGSCALRTPALATASSRVAATESSSFDAADHNRSTFSWRVSRSRSDPFSIMGCPAVLLLAGLRLVGHGLRCGLGARRGALRAVLHVRLRVLHALLVMAHGSDLLAQARVAVGRP